MHSVLHTSSSSSPRPRFETPRRACHQHLGRVSVRCVSAENLDFYCTLSSPKCDCKRDPTCARLAVNVHVVGGPPPPVPAVRTCLQPRRVHMILWYTVKWKKSRCAAVHIVSSPFPKKSTCFYVHRTKMWFGNTDFPGREDSKRWSPVFSGVGSFLDNCIDFTLTILREQPHLGINILVYLKQSLCLWLHTWNVCPRALRRTKVTI